MAPEVLATNLYLGRVIAVARQRKGWTQTDLAEACGLGRTLIMDIETGRIGLNAERRLTITRALSLQTHALDAPGFAVLTPEEHRLIAEAHAGTPKPTRTRLLAGRLTPVNLEGAPC